MYGSKISSHKGEQVRLQDKREGSGEGEMLIKIKKRAEQVRVRDSMGTKRGQETRGKGREKESEVKEGREGMR